MVLPRDYRGKLPTTRSPLARWREKAKKGYDSERLGNQGKTAQTEEGKGGTEYYHPSFGTPAVWWTGDKTDSLSIATDQNSGWPGVVGNSVRSFYPGNPLTTVPGSTGSISMASIPLSGRWPRHGEYFYAVTITFSERRICPQPFN